MLKKKSAVVCSSHFHSISITFAVAAPQLDEFEEEDRITKLSREQLEQLGEHFMLSASPLRNK